MPAPLLPIIAGGAQIIGSGINAVSQGSQNRRSQRFAREMYSLQRTHALEDWHRQNEYNSPINQMQRLKDAGLNPVLAFGNSNNAGNAGSVSSTPVQKPDFKSPDFSGVGAGVSTALNLMYDFEMKQAQIDNLKEQNSVIAEEAQLKKAQTLNVMKNTDRTAFDLALDSQLRQISVDARKENLRQKKVETNIMLDKNEREEAMNGANLRESMERVLTHRLNRSKTVREKAKLKAQIQGIYKDNQLKQFDIELRRMGINPNHPMYAQILGRILNQGLNWRNETEFEIPKFNLFKMFK